MENKKPEFAFTERSVISLVTEMRAYFQDLKSYYSITKGEIISQLDKVIEEAKISELQSKLQEVNDKIASFSVLGDALSIADTILHTEGMIAELSSKAVRTDPETHGSHAHQEAVGLPRRSPALGNADQEKD